MLIHRRTDDPTLAMVAYDISTTQAQQSGQMYGWLEAWGAPQYSERPLMSWIAGHSEHGAPRAGGMPGMATPAEVTALKEASGLPADRMFLQLMIEHHQGAVEMADGILARSDDDTVTALANAILRSQNSEIALLEGMLAELPAD